MGQSCHATDRQSHSNTGNQREFRMLGEARRPVPADPELVDHCKNAMDSVRLCIHLSNFSHDHICSALGIDNGHWTRIMQGRAHFPLNKLIALQELCGNTAPTQYQAAQFGWNLVDRKPMEVIERAA